MTRHQFSMQNKSDLMEEGEEGYYFFNSAVMIFSASLIQIEKDTLNEVFLKNTCL